MSLPLLTAALPVLTEGNTLRVTSPFGWRADPVTGTGNGQHKGIDLVLWRGWSALSGIGAAWSGTVTAVRDGVEGFSRTQSRGNYVIIDHGGGVNSHYYHLAAGSVAVRPGDPVTAGQRLGTMGATGYSTGAHLHFQVEIRGVPTDPLPFLTGEASPFPASGGATEVCDNTPADWAAEAVQWAVQSGILRGDEHGDYRLHEPCTREMMLVFLHRALS